MSTNTIVITGNLAGPVQLRRTSSGTPVAHCRVLESQRRKDEPGEWVDAEPNAFAVVAWGRLAQHAAESLDTGAAVIVVGRIATEVWTDETGQARTTQQVVAEHIGLSLRWRSIVVRPDAGGEPR